MLNVKLMLNTIQQEFNLHEPESTKDRKPHLLQLQCIIVSKPVSIQASFMTGANLGIELALTCRLMERHQLTGLLNDCKQGARSDI